MTDARTPGDDDALPPFEQQHHREPSSSGITDESNLPHLETATSGADMSSDGKQSGEGHNRGFSEQGQSSTSAPPTDEPVKSPVDPTIAKHVGDVLSSEVETTRFSCAVMWLNNALVFVLN